MINLLKNITGFISTKMVLIVRSDLKMNSGKIASQCAHAATTLYDNAINKTNNSVLLKTWLKMGQPKIVLKIDCEENMRTVFNNAKNSGLNACLIYDAGKTQVKSGTLTVLGIGPNKSEDIDKITANLKLL